MTARTGKGPREWKERWNRPEFLVQVQPLLEQLFQAREICGPHDLRGMDIGPATSTEALAFRNFAGSEVASVDLSAGRFHCSFSGASLNDVNLSGAAFEGCNMIAMQARNSCFDKSRVRARLDDAIFENCTFSGSSFSSMGPSLVCLSGGRRVRFQSCNFDNCRMRRNFWRASHFRECSFRNAQLFECDLRGVRFENCQFPDCTFHGNLIEHLEVIGDPPPMFEY